MVSVVGIGLCSAAGARARDHAFFLRAEGPPPAASPFRLADGRRWDVRRASFLAPVAATGEGGAARLGALASMAADEALAALPEEARRGLPLFLCLPAPRAGLDATALDDLAAAVGKHVGASSIVRLSGAASPLAALERIGAEAEAALLVAVDSFVSLADATAAAARPPCPWLLQPPPPGEGAGALLLASRAQASRWGARPLANVPASRGAVGRATDENDEPNDAAAMTDVMANLPTRGPIAAVFGQGRVDQLRVQDWERTVARLAPRFHPVYAGACLESEVGQLGSAAGVMGLGYAIACLRHGVLEAPEGATVTWALSRDGLRAAAVVEADGRDALTALHTRAAARKVERAPFRAPGAEEDDEEELEEEELPPVGPAADADATLREIEQLEALEAAQGEARTIEEAPRALPRAIEPTAAVHVEPARTFTLDGFYEDVVRNCCDTAAMLVLDRVEGSWEDALEAEARLLCQLDAVVASGADPLGAVVRWWDGEADDGWSGQAASLLCLAFAGDDALGAVQHGVAAVPPDDAGVALAVAEGILLSEHPGVGELGEALAASFEAVPRAVGLLVTPPDPGAIAVALTDDESVVRRAAVWAAERLAGEHRDEIAPHLQLALHHEEAWSAARVLALWGGDEGLGVLDALGPFAGDMMVLSGRPEDVPALERAIARQPPSPILIDGVARFGSPRLLEWLLGLLSDTALAEPAAEGLAVMLGPLHGGRAVDPARALDRSAWREAIARIDPSPDRRYRLGRPWAVPVVLEECADGTLSRRAIARRVDELRARLGLPDPVALWRWHAEAQRELDTFLSAARARPR
jgi:hypothetical protein